MKNKRLTVVVSLLAIYLFGAFFVNQKETNSKKETVTVGVLQFAVSYTHLTLPTIA